MHDKVVSLINSKVSGANPELLKKEAGDAVIYISSDKVHEVCAALKTDSELNFNVLQVITGCDYLAKEAKDDKPAEEERIEVSYILASYPQGHSLILKTKLSRSNPEVESVCDLWHSANFQERECYDMVGVNFKSHPDLRRILLPEDWEDFPLRKDYVVQKEWHGMEINPEDKMNLPEREFDKRMKEMQKKQKEEAAATTE